MKWTYLDSTRQLAREGNYQEALSRYIWFDKHILEVDSGMEGVKRSFALNYWIELSREYKPALDSFLRIREEKRRKVLEEGTSVDLFADVVAMNRELGETYKTINLFDSINSKFPALAKKSWWYCIDDLLADKKYDLLSNNLSSPMEAYQKFDSIYRVAIEDVRGFDRDLEYPLKESFKKRCTKLIQYCLAINDYKSVSAIKENYRLITKEALP